jgi:fused signal recognition particle receptor
MFKFLKEKISSWVKKPTKEEDKANITEKPDERKKSEKKKNPISKKKSVNEEKLKNKVDTNNILIRKEKVEKEIINEDEIENLKEEKTDNKEPEKLEKEEKKGFFKKLFSKTEKKDKEQKEIEEKVDEKFKEEIKQERIYKEDDEKEEVEEKPNFFTKIIKKITTSELTKEDFNEAFEEFEITLLENNVALEAVDKIKETLEKELVGKHVKKSDANKIIIDALKDSILSVLKEPPNLIDEIKNSQEIYTIIFFGINGTGKTTSIAKIAHLLKKNNISSVLAAADTFRAASIEQLKEHAKKIDVPIIFYDYGSDPASVIFEAKKYAKTNNIKVVLADTAGRMYTKDNLIKEMEKIIRVNKPDLKMFVGESITGNDVIDQCKKFNEAIGIDGIILSKADIDEKAGAILSVSHITSKPIYFLGTGQNYDDLILFSKETVIKNLGLE